MNTRAQQVTEANGQWRRSTIALGAPYARKEQSSARTGWKRRPAQTSYVEYESALSRRKLRSALSNEHGIAGATEALKVIAETLTTITCTAASLAIQQGTTYDEYYERLQRFLGKRDGVLFVANGFSIMQNEPEMGADNGGADVLAHQIAECADRIRISVINGYLDASRAHEFHDVLGVTAAISFSGWSAYGGALLQHSVASVEAEVQWLLTDPHSPWILEPWLV